MKSTRMMTPKALLSMSLALGLMACAQPTDESTAKLTSGSKPGDSQGLAADIQLQFNSTAAGTTALAANMDLGNGLVLTEAKLNIAKIKIKPEEDEDESEVDQESEFKAMREARKEEIKEQEATFEEQMEDIKKSYDEQMQNAASEAAKDSLEVAEITKSKLLKRLWLLNTKPLKTKWTPMKNSMMLI